MKKTAFPFLLALLFCIHTDARAQIDTVLVKIFESEPGTQPFSLLGDPFEFDSRFDANGDGTPELILTREDSDGNLQGLRVVKTGGVEVVLWDVPDVSPLFASLAEKDGMKLYGFADPDADGEREALFATEQDVVLINPSDNTLSWGTVLTDLLNQLIGVTDLTGDGFEEIILFLPEMQVVQVWSRAP